MKVVMYSEHWNGFWCLPPRIVNDLQSEFPEIQFVHARNEEKIGDSITDADIYFGYRLRKKEADAATRLRWVHVPAASVHPLTDLGLQERGVIVTNSAGLHAPPISEHVIGC